MVSVTCRSPRMEGEPAGICGNCGRPSSAMFSLPEEPRILKLRTWRRKSAGRSASCIDSRKVRRTSRLETTSFACRRSPLASRTPRAHRLIDIAHVVVQQYVGAAGRAWPEGRADDGTASHVRLDDVALEVLLEKIGRAHGPEAQRVIHALFTQAVEAARQIEKFPQVARLE